MIYIFPFLHFFQLFKLDGIIAIGLVCSVDREDVVGGGGWDEWLPSTGTENDNLLIFIFGVFLVDFDNGSIISN